MVTVMMVAEQLGGTLAMPIQYATSADSHAGKSNTNRVVGYFSGAIVKGDSIDNYLLPKLNPEDKKIIIKTAKQAVNDIINKVKPEYPDIDIPLQLQDNYAAFVTIKKHGQLRACMGHTFSSVPLLQEIRQAAILAATQDYRFGAITKNELANLEFEVTILSRMIKIIDTNQIVIGRDGLFIRENRNTGILLPQVATEYNWDINIFLENLCRKAGIAKDAYKNPLTELFAFRAIVIH